MEKIKYFTIIKNPIFLTGLFIRIILILMIMPQAAASWYVPFLKVTTHYFTLNPWQTFINAGGSWIAFPYGYAMWILFLPLTLLCNLFHINLYFGYAFTLILADFGLLITLKLLLQPNNRLLLTAYWLSPIVIFATYWFGLNDIVPVFLLCLALYFLRNLKVIAAGIFCGLAISAKLSMILAIPFFMIYLFRNLALRQLFPKYLVGLTIVTIMLGLPFLLSQPAMLMLLHNPEMNKIYELSVQIGTVHIYILPMMYLLMLYSAWYMRRINFELLNTLLGVSFFLVVLLTPASPGWFIWIMPLFLLYQQLKGKKASFLVTGFTILYVIIVFLKMPISQILNLPKQYYSATIINNIFNTHEIAFLHTILLTFGVILALRIWRELILNNEFFRLSRKPLVIGIAGDSGAGKDTLVHSLQGLFGSHSVVTLSGDDYHLWDRHKPMWQVMTHLNPQANDLERYAKDLISLTAGKTINVRHYNHQTGKTMRHQRVESNDLIITSGLHALYLPILRNCYDLSIYLDIDEDLRRYFKIQRDVYIRGHELEHVFSSINKREFDSKYFVRPQAKYADLILSLQPIHPHILKQDNQKKSIPLKLLVCSRRSLNEESLLRVLIGICGLHVDMKMDADKNEVELIIEGETTADDIALAAKTLLPNIKEFLDIIPRWEDGVRGLMQLIVLSHINQVLSERLIW